MARKKKTKRQDKPLATIWHVPDEVWNEVAELIREYDPPRKTGRPRTDQRKALDGILYRMRSGVQWNQLPQEFGDDSSVHRAFQRWVACGLFEKLWAILLLRCDELGGVDWQWQAADGILGKARLGGTRSARIPRIGPRPAANAAC